MKKVLFVATITKHINTFHIPYLKWFKEQGYEVHVASNGNEQIENCDKHFDLPFERFPLKINNLKTYRQLKKIIEENKYEIIHCHTPVGGVLTRLAAKNVRQNGTRVIYTAHGFHFYKGAPLLNWLIYYPIEKYLSRFTDCLITINKEDFELAKKNFRINQIELVHGVGVDEKKYNVEFTIEEKNKLRHSLGLKNDDFILIQIGELNKNKNQIMSINVMKDLVKKYDHIKLLIIGSGKLEKKYKNTIVKYELQNNVCMLGYREDIPQILKISDLLLSLSYREGLPVNVIEAMFADLPIIATDCRGNRDLINNLVKINDKEKLKYKIEKEYMNRNKKIYNIEKYKIKTILHFIVEKVYREGKKI